ncbi:hypothetical protein [Geobacillus sp. LEMMY01]|uniref:hypothetical protein n=1 Tax=Geobacillus sp. LEMMY01 TaxID=1954237 RepID=UPI0009ACE7A6|nr:hypothetical protein [Geobacillus sp. LEMMY01]OPX02304.1 hypothetical protein B1A75_13970 [Geobacillus sp. LEMMY01]
MGERAILMVPIITIFMFLGITLGGIFSFLFRFILGMKIERIFVFCGGLLLGLILFELLPESFTQNSWMGIVLGVFVNYHFISAQKRLFFAHSFGISLSPFPKECAKFFVNYFGMGHG